MSTYRRYRERRLQFQALEPRLPLTAGGPATVVGGCAIPHDASPPNIPEEDVADNAVIEISHFTCSTQLDVDGDGQVSGSDFRAVMEQLESAPTYSAAHDVNGDGHLSPRDALMIAQEQNEANGQPVFVRPSTEDVEMHLPHARRFAEALDTDAPPDDDMVSLIARDLARIKQTNPEADTRYGVLRIGGPDGLLPIDIWPDDGADYRKYTFGFGSGDCPAGCISNWLVEFYINDHSVVRVNPPSYSATVVALPIE